MIEIVRNQGGWCLIMAVVQDGQRRSFSSVSPLSMSIFLRFAPPRRWRWPKPPCRCCEKQNKHALQIHSALNGDKSTCFKVCLLHSPLFKTFPSNVPFVILRLIRPVSVVVQAWWNTYTSLTVTTPLASSWHIFPPRPTLPFFLFSFPFFHFSHIFSVLQFSNGCSWSSGYFVFVCFSVFSC